MALVLLTDSKTHHILLQKIDLLKIALTIAEATACIVGFRYWKKLKDTYWKFFPVYLACILAAELLGRYLGYKKLYTANLALYNYFVIPLEILFFISLFYRTFSTRSLKRLSIIVAFIYMACWFSEMFLLPKVSSFWVGALSYTVGIVTLLVLILSYLFKLSSSDEIVFIKHNMMFWVCMGLFVFYAFSLPFYGMYNYLYKHHYNFYLTYSNIIFFLNYIMYGLFTLAFIWGKPKSSFS